MMRLAVLAAALAVAGYAATPVSFQTHYLPMDPQDGVYFVAPDPSGNLFVIQSLNAQSTVSFRILKTDPDGNPLGSFDVIGLDSPTAAVADASGNVFLSTRGAIQKIDWDLRQMTSFSLGDPEKTVVEALAIDGAGNVYATGNTYDKSFPVTPGAYQTKPPASGEFSQVPPFIAIFSFVTKLSPGLDRIIYSTYFGHNSLACYGESCSFGDLASTYGNAIAVDSSGSVILSGKTNAPALGGAQTNGYFQQIPWYGFIAKFSPDGSALTAYNSVCRGLAASFDNLAFDSKGNIVVGGYACTALNIPANVFEPTTSRNSADAFGFVGKYDSNLQNLITGTYFGFSEERQITGTSYVGYSQPIQAHGLAIDAADCIWLTGSVGVPVLPGQVTANRNAATYIGELSSDLTSLLTFVTTPLAGRTIGYVPAYQRLVVSGAKVIAGQTGPDSVLISGPPDQPSLLAVANSATNVSSGTIAPEELISLYGLNIGPGSEFGGQVQNGAFTSTLGGYQVLFNGVSAPLLYAGPNQINVVAPRSIAAGQTAAIEVVGPDKRTLFPTAFVAPARPQVFSNLFVLGPRYGYGSVLFQDAVALNQDGTVNSKTNPAATGSTITLWVTGAGLSSAQGSDGALSGGPSPLSLPVSAQTWDVPPVPLEVIFAGDAPGSLFGLAQINVRLPANWTYQTLGVVAQAGGVSSFAAQVYVAGNGQ